MRITSVYIRVFLYCMNRGNVSTEDIDLKWQKIMI